MDVRQLRRHRGRCERKWLNASVNVLTKKKKTYKAVDTFIKPTDDLCLNRSLSLTPTPSLLCCKYCIQPRTDLSVSPLVRLAWLNTHSLSSECTRYWNEFMSLFFSHTDLKSWVLVWGTPAPRNYEAVPYSRKTMNLNLLLVNTLVSVLSVFCSQAKK